MAIRRWDPLRDLLELQERMNRLLETSLVQRRFPGPELGAVTWVPLADAYETSEGFVVQLELPGLEQEDIEVHVDGDTVVVRGQRRMKGQAESFHRMERSYGSFARSFKLTAEVDPDRVKAQFRDGLLRLELPKTHPRPSWRGRGDKRE